MGGNMDRSADGGTAVIDALDKPESSPAERFGAELPGSIAIRGESGAVFLTERRGGWDLIHQDGLDVITFGRLRIRTVEGAPQAFIEGRSAMSDRAADAIVMALETASARADVPTLALGTDVGEVRAAMARRGYEAADPIRFAAEVVQRIPGVVRRQVTDRALTSEDLAPAVLEQAIGDVTRALDAPSIQLDQPALCYDSHADRVVVPGLRSTALADRLVGHEVVHPSNLIGVTARWGSIGGDRLVPLPIGDALVRDINWVGVRELAHTATPARTRQRSRGADVVAVDDLAGLLVRDRVIGELRRRVDDVVEVRPLPPVVLVPADDLSGNALEMPSANIRFEVQWSKGESFVVFAPNTPELRELDVAEAAAHLVRLLRCYPNVPVSALSFDDARAHDAYGAPDGLGRANGFVDVLDDVIHISQSYVQSPASQLEQWTSDVAARHEGHFTPSDYSPVVATATHEFGHRVRRTLNRAARLDVRPSGDEVSLQVVAPMLEAPITSMTDLFDPAKGHRAHLAAAVGRLAAHDPDELFAELFVEAHGGQCRADSPAERMSAMLPSLVALRR